MYRDTHPRRQRTAMKSLLVRNIHTLVTMDPGVREIRNAAMLVRGNRIEALGR